MARAPPAPPFLFSNVLPLSAVDANGTLFVENGAPTNVTVKSVFVATLTLSCQPISSPPLPARPTTPVMSVGGLVPPFDLR